MVQSEKHIPLDANSFEADGKTYIIHASVNVERYAWLQDLQVRSAFGADYGQLMNAFREWVRLKNEKKDFDADIKLRNTFEGVTRKAWKQHDPLILICTLFMCSEDEDRTKWDEEAANEKIKAWSAEGYPTENFLRWGVRYTEVYQTNYLDATPTTLEATE